MSAAADLARSIRRVFRAQKELAYGGKEKFGDWDHRLANAMKDSLRRLYTQRSRQVAGESSDAESAAAERSLLAARSVNDTTQEWLEQGRDPDVVFSDDRVVAIVTTETSAIVHDAILDAAKSRGSKLVWRSRDRACPECRSLNGKRVAAGKQNFVSKGGIAAKAPPLHPHCNCTVEEV